MTIKISTIGFSFFLFFTSILNASIIAVVDSGNDFAHQDLINHAWENPIDNSINDRDEDKNGYPDDVNGWNFADKTNLLMDYSYAYSYTDDVKKFFEIQLKSMLGTITESERNWAKEKFKDQTFLKNIQIFGNWMHGTHVTGIAIKDSSDAKVVGMKLIPTEVKLPGKNMVDHFSLKKDGMKEFIFKAALKNLAQEQAKTYLELGSYINNVGADVANGSFGTSFSVMSEVISKLYKVLFRKEVTNEDLNIFTRYYFSINLEETKKFLAASPHTLFIFAAGNEGSDNDIYPSSPTNVEAENKISVAATLGDRALATFSCFGGKQVDVAAPGVGIDSTIPKNGYLAVSGTSQAAPYVANIAGKIKDINPKLGFREIKKIILETVDLKTWLKGKVRTQGLVNRKRAIRAAELSLGLNLSSAIKKSFEDVFDQSKNDKQRSLEYFQIPLFLIQSLPSPIVLIE